MDPIAFKIFSFPIRWYGVMAALGVCAAYLMIRKNRNYAKISSDQAADITFLLIASGVIGARIFYIFQFFDQFRYTYINGVRVLRSNSAMLLEMLKIYNGGIVFYGGFICAVIAMIIYCRIKKLDFWKLTDMCVPGLAVGHAFGRLGCFLNGCCFGKPNSWGIIYPHGTPPAHQYPDMAHAKLVQIDGAMRTVFPSLHLHPVQLYETVSNIALAILLNFTLRKFKRGQNLAFYMFLYGIIRFSDEFFRGDHQTADLFFGVFTPAQFIGLFLIPTGIVLFFYFQKKENGDLKLDIKDETPDVNKTDTRNADK